MTDERIQATAALNHLGAVINHLRPDWNPEGIRTALTQALEQHPFSHVHRIATSAAEDATARTPAVIPIRCNNGWMENRKDETPTSTPPTFHRGPYPALKCGACGWTQREDSCHPITAADPDECGMCHRCHGCGADRLHPHIIGPEEQKDINARGNAKVKAALGDRAMVKGLPE